MLIILDGWGIGKNDDSNGIYLAKTPTMDRLMTQHPNSTLTTFGEAVGLPEGQMGNSEVGHLNIGAGRVVYQMLARINKTFAEKSILNMPSFQRFLEAAKKTKGNIHLMGLLSNGGVHSSITHLFDLIDILKLEKLDHKVKIHAFLDGRDTDPKSGLGFLNQLNNHIMDSDAKLVSIIGRYYAMDRDKRWERTTKAYELLTQGKGEYYEDYEDGIKKNYAKNISDEFMESLILTKNKTEFIGDGDVVLNFNFRTDRPRQITQMLAIEPFNDYQTQPLDIGYFSITQYDKDFDSIQVIFDNEDIKMTLGEYISSKGLTQIRAAETEKYPHVTFFFSGGRETVFEGEERILISSPKVATYDLKPEMSALELTDSLIESIEKQDIDFYAINYANPDMVGHTGIPAAIVKACETVDLCIKRLIEVALRKDFNIIVIADHGNADYIKNDDGSPNTAHSKNKVPCIYVGSKTIVLQDGILADIAPTLLELMELEKPQEMTGKSLIVK